MCGIQNWIFKKRGYLISRFGKPVLTSLPQPHSGYFCCHLGSGEPSSIALLVSVVQVPRTTISQLLQSCLLQLCHHPVPLLPTPPSRCPSDIVHVVVHSNSIFPCSIAHNSFYSMLSGGGNWSPYAKHHYRSSIRDNESRQAKFALPSTHMDCYRELLAVQLFRSWCDSRV